MHPPIIFTLCVYAFVSLSSSNTRLLRIAAEADGLETIPLGKLSSKLPCLAAEIDQYVYSNSWCDPFKTWQKVSSNFVV